ncbi:hypothetical protein KJ865_10555, partial [Myxococcota bacterium]|nr:hypothetical protein [Myxococcota bacterium]
CGDGVVTGNEECDVDAYGGESCETLGYHGGTLLCNYDCTIGTEICEYFGRCQDETVQPLFEECDMSDLGGATCESLGYYGGTLGCTGGCRFDVTQCEGAGYCGDAVANGSEQCDGSDLNGHTCATMGYYGSGGVACNADCTLDLSACGGTCGDGEVQPGFEHCDGDVSSLTCRDFGYVSGIITNCNADCTINALSCVSASQVGSTADDAVNGGLMDAQGNIFIVGTLGAASPTKGPGDSIDFVLSRIDPDGVWTSTTYGSDGDDRAIGMAVDPVSGDIVVAGNTDGTLGASSFGLTDIFVARFSSAGVPGPVVQAGSADMADDFATAVAVDGASNVFVVGYTMGDFDGNGGNGSYDAIAIKFDAGGNELWRLQVDGGFSMDFFYGAAVDAAGNLYAVGKTDGDVGAGLMGQGTSYLMLFKISPAGDTLWVQAISSMSSEAGYSVRCGPQGQVYVAGTTMWDYANDTFSEYMSVLVGGFTGDGTPLFTTSWGGGMGGMGDDEGRSLEVLPDGRLVVVGIAREGFLGQNVGFTSQIFAVEASPTAGTPLSVQIYGDLGEESVTGTFLTPGGSVIATGTTSGSISGEANQGGLDGYIYTVFVP